jgi:antitoxin Phd
MTTTMSAADARKRFAEIINQVAYGHDTVVLTRRGEKIAALVSMEELELLQQIEDAMDIEEAKKALAEPGENIPAAEFWRKLGL